MPTRIAIADARLEQPAIEIDRFAERRAFRAQTTEIGRVIGIALHFDAGGLRSELALRRENFANVPNFLVGGNRAMVGQHWRKFQHCHGMFDSSISVTVTSGGVSVESRNISATRSAEIG